MFTRRKVVIIRRKDVIIRWLFVICVVLAISFPIFQHSNVLLSTNDEEQQHFSVAPTTTTTDHHQHQHDRRRRTIQGHRNDNYGADDENVVHILYGLLGNKQPFMQQWEVSLKSVLLNLPLDQPTHIHLICNPVACESILNLFYNETYGIIDDEDDVPLPYNFI